MSIQIKSTKKFKYLPCAHAQWFDENPDGSPGHCASVHGYDREVEITFAGNVDEYGWLVPFGQLKKVKEFLEYYFDHVTVLPANDPRIKSIPREMIEPGGILGTLRVLPYGVSMEMSALFVWEYVNEFVFHTTGGRCYVEKVQMFEHDRNSGIVEVDEATARKDARRKISSSTGLLPKASAWIEEPPHDALDRLDS